MFAEEKENNLFSGGVIMAIKRFASKKKKKVIVFSTFFGLFFLLWISLIGSSSNGAENKDFSGTGTIRNQISNEISEVMLPEKLTKTASINEELRLLQERLLNKEKELAEREKQLEQREELSKNNGMIRKPSFETPNLEEFPSQDRKNQLSQKKETGLQEEEKKENEEGEIKQQEQEEEIRRKQQKREQQEQKQLILLDKIKENNASILYLTDLEKQQAVREAFLFAWNGYKDKAWGRDELHPLDGSSSNWIGMGLTIVDSLDTMWIMGLHEEFAKAKEWIASALNFNIHREISLFETTIRVLGGLLSAFEFSKDTMFLHKATELAEKFLPVFDTPTGIPFCMINLKTGSARNPGWTGGKSILSEVGSIQLEFLYLSKHTNRSIFAEKALQVYKQLDKTIKKPPGLYSVYVDPNSGQLERQHITLGALGDSFYEYLLKLWILTGKQPDSQYRRMYDESAKAIILHLVKKSSPNKLVFIAEMLGGSLNYKMDHLVCFAGAMFALGAQGETMEEHFRLGQDITRTCYELYRRTPTGIAPELVYFMNSAEDFEIPSNSHHYLLRPETVESLFVLWRLTHNQIYRDWGWEIFQAINRSCKVAYGFSGIRDVTSKVVTHDNMQQSFFLAETLKYLYLLFSEDNLVPLDKYVFNTEAHPLGIFQ